MLLKLIFIVAKRVVIRNHGYGLFLCSKTTLIGGAKTMEQKKLTKELSTAAANYYNSGVTIMSDEEFDIKKRRLQELESASGIIYPGSPTTVVGAKVIGKLSTAKHEQPALSLEKVNLSDPTAIQVIKDFMGDEECICDWKEDGSTVVVTYDNGILTKAVTRGDGITGSVITHNARYFVGLPQKIDFKGHLVARGEATMKESEFKRVNDLAGGIYENARNLATATIQMLDSEESRKREIWFNAFELVVPEVDTTEQFHFLEAIGQLRTILGRMAFLDVFGFNTVERKTVNADTVEDVIRCYEKDLTSNDSNAGFRNDMPTDGLVFTYNDQMCANSRYMKGDTGHHPHGWLAMKWKDESYQTTIQKVIWQVGRTGIVTPVAEFAPVRMGLGSTVNRATLHNLSIMKQKNIHINAKAQVYMANMIIPAVLSCEDGDEVEIPTVCPVCGAALVNDGTALRCVNPDCAAQKLGKFVHFCEKDCMNIDGMSEKTVAKLIDAGFLKEFADFYHLSEHREEMESWEGFGEKAVDNMLSAIEASRKTNFVGFIHALGIPNIGKGQAKLLAKYENNDIEKFFRDCCNGTDFSEIEGIGDVIYNSIHQYFFVPYQSGILNTNDRELPRLLKELTFEKVEENKDNTLDGQIFVITGSVEHFANRDELKDFIESKGGKTSGSVSKNTTYLINNDVESTSGKNKKAKELGVEIISEEGFLKMV